MNTTKRGLLTKKEWLSANPVQFGRLRVVYPKTLNLRLKRLVAPLMKKQVVVRLRSGEHIRGKLTSVSNAFLVTTKKRANIVVTDTQTLEKYKKSGATIKPTKVLVLQLRNEELGIEGMTTEKVCIETVSELRYNNFTN